MAEETRLRIVVADDHPSIRENLRALLNAEPDLLVVDVAKNGLDAARLVRRHGADVLIVDADMPGADGISVTGALRASGARTRVIVYTMRTELCERACAAGAAACVSKDVPYGLLVDAVRAAGIYLVDRRSTSPRPKVLVVEDDDASREMLVTALGELGFQVSAAPNGERALVECARQEPDVIVLDLLMPVMSGRDFLRAYRRRPSRRARIVALSALPRAPEIARELGCDVRLTKPLDIGQLVRSVAVLACAQVPLGAA